MEHKAHTKSTTVFVPPSELGLPHPLSRKRVYPPPGTKGTQYTLALRGPNSDEWRKSLPLYLLCVGEYILMCKK